jgi:hypothetical protein
MTQSISQVNVENVEGYQGSQEFWDKIDSSVIATFMFDCWSQDKFKSIPLTLMNSFYSKEKLEELERLTDPSIFKIQSPGNSFTLSEIQQLFQKHHPEYRRVLRSKLGQVFLKIEPSIIEDFKSTLTHKELVLTVNALTPLKRMNWISTFSPEEKIEVAKQSQVNFTQIDLERTEKTLMDKLSKLSIPGQSPEQFNFSSITDFMFKPLSFHEDEQLFARAGKEQNYFSPLMCIDVFQTQDWEEFSAQESALVFFGYSDLVKDQVAEKYPGKKNEWFRSFLDKYNAMNPEFNSALVESVREKFKTKFNAVVKPGDPSEQKMAS